MAHGQNAFCELGRTLHRSRLQDDRSPMGSSTHYLATLKVQESTTYGR
jgi:hypothetical protein